MDEGSDQKSDIKPHRMAAHAGLKNEFTEDEKCHNLMTWLNLRDLQMTSLSTIHDIGEELNKKLQAYLLRS